MAEQKRQEPLSATYEPGKPEKAENWRAKLTSREQMLGYLETAESYWYGKKERRDPT